jgi:hypothetical protein
MPVEILIDENDRINAIVSTPDVKVEIIAKVIRKGDTMPSRKRLTSACASSSGISAAYRPKRTSTTK